MSVFWTLKLHTPIPESDIRKAQKNREGQQRNLIHVPVLSCITARQTHVERRITRTLHNIFKDLRVGKHS